MKIDYLYCLIDYVKCLKYNQMQDVKYLANQNITVYTPIVDPSLLQDLPLKIQIEDPSKSNQRQ